MLICLDRSCAICLLLKWHDLLAFAERSETCAGKSLCGRIIACSDGQRPIASFALRQVGGDRCCLSVASLVQHDEGLLASAETSRQGGKGSSSGSRSWRGLYSSLNGWRAPAFCPAREVRVKGDFISAMCPFAPAGLGWDTGTAQQDGDTWLALATSDGVEVGNDHHRDSITGISDLYEHATHDT